MLFLGLGLLAVINSSRTLWEIYSRSQRLSQARAEVSALGQENAELKRQLANADRSDFVENLAREKLNLVFPGEKILILPEKLSRELGQFPQTPGEPEPNWRLWWKLFF